ncbi:MAG: hypothetical protein HFJ53_01845 [Clostridia bacterium]|jgi:preprotein translocase subunit SecF|nr:hypothetical protein [Clostridia bacterium]
MEKKMKNKIIVYSVMTVVTLLGIVATYFFRLNFSLMYADHVKLDIYIEKGCNIEDIKNIAQEVFGNQEIKYQKISDFNDEISINIKEVTDEQEEELKNKLIEKYELEETQNILTKTNIGKIRARDILKPYIIPIIIATLLIIGYTGIWYMKLGSIKIMFELFINILLIQGVYWSIITILELPIGIYTMPISILIYIITVVATSIKNQNSLENVLKQEVET